MLQQTQAIRVAQRLPEFLDLFPTVHALAEASNGTIVRAWQGMGYNSRALRLRDAARLIVSQFNGYVPRDPADLRTLPGIGPYASASIACFAYDVRVVVLDVNIRRVYSRVQKRMQTTIATVDEARLHAFADDIIPPRRPSLWHNAVMELGAVICTARAPKCSECPLAMLCPSAGQMLEARRPRAAEPMFRGEPHRLWRGRAVELLRALPTDADVSFRRLFRQLTKTSPTDAELEWIRTLVHGIARDGLVHVHGDRVRLHD